YHLCLKFISSCSLTVTGPEGPIQAKPGSDVLLPCNFEESSGHIDPERLAVIWSVGTRDIAKYEDKLEVFHPGAKMSSEGLLRGNASILLPNVQDADGTTYTCFVIHSPDSEKKSVVLRVEGKRNQGKQNEGQMITLFKGRRQHRLKTLIWNKPGHFMACKAHPDGRQFTYVCRVEHEGFETPLERSVHWRPGEGNALIYPNLPVTQNTRNTFFSLLFSAHRPKSLTVTVPEGPIQAKPGSDVLLPCYFEESSGHIDPKRLAVIWSVGTRDIAKYEDKLEVFHPGAKMSSEGLLRGNASILLPNVQDADGTTYTCFVIHSPDSEKKSVVLRVEGKRNQGKQNEGQMITLFKGRRQHRLKGLI
uniref:Ig-like domain-containing protein n=1 Tax=Pseudonaja textilis TaxID=8673 RepID=A0A670ZCH5_PSETE